MKISIEGLQFYAYHGYYEQEKRIGGNYEVAIHIDTSYTQGAFSDQLSETINYETLIDIADQVMQQPVRLIEHVAQKIATGIYNYFCCDQDNIFQITHIEVKVAKLNPPVRLVLRQTAVTYEINTQMPNLKPL